MEPRTSIRRFQAWRLSGSPRLGVLALLVAGTACAQAATTVTTAAAGTASLAATMSSTASPAKRKPIFPRPTAADCQREPAVTLAPPPPGAPGASARALMLGERALLWPGQPAEGVLRLHHAGAGQLSIGSDSRVSGALAAETLSPDTSTLAPDVARRFRWAGEGRRATLPGREQLRKWLRGELLLTREDADGRVLAATRLQHAAALDELYAAAAKADDLGVQLNAVGARMRVWAPTAQSVALCVHGAQPAVHRMNRQRSTGIWSARVLGLRDGFYSYLVDVHVPGHGWVRNRVTDPYAVGLNADSQASWVGRLDDPRTQPPGWQASKAPARVRHQTDMVIYELHVRDFSRDDATVRPAWRGKYLGFAEPQSDGMKHLRALSQAGLTDVHLLPVFDLASVPERGCVSPEIAPGPDGRGGADSPEPQAALTRVKDRDCYNWGYDPWHFTAPEGSFATDPDDGPGRIREFRQMVMALHAAGLRVGMDVVYNHTTAAGQHPKSVLDRLVPGYYQRLNAAGEIERSTCCDNTATEHLMMGKLMSDSVVIWARDHRIDSFRFDLMGHQPRDEMLAIQRRLKAEVGRDVQLIGEGWNFGEVANGARFVQASQLELNGSGIGTFSDRARDAVRGGGAGDGGADQITRQGYVNGLHYDPNPRAVGLASVQDLGRSADLVRVGLAGSLRGYRMTTHDGRVQALQDIPYGGNQPAGYVREPSEVVNYVENHDNQTLYDINAFKLPPGTTTEDRARVQMLAVAINMFSQGVAYFHAGVELLRSKSMDRNSYDSGDWFNRIDWTGQDNFFGTGLPPAWDNRESWPLMQPLLADPSLRPRPADIAWARGQFLDLLRIRASTPLLRLPTAAEIERRLRLPTAAGQAPTVLVGHLDGQGLPQAGFRDLVYLVNVDLKPQSVDVAALQGRALVLHPVHRAAGATDRRVQEARFDAASGRFTVPARTAVVWVRE